MKLLTFFVSFIVFLCSYISVNPESYVYRFLFYYSRIDHSFSGKSTKDLFITPPKSYDWRTEHPECQNPIRDQGSCGSCYAFSTTSFLEDRFCAKYHRNVSFSPQNLVDCDPFSRGCEWGLTFSALWYIESHGIVQDECYPYKHVAGECQYRSPLYKGKCNVSGVYAEKYFLDDFVWVYPSEEMIMKEIYSNGPVMGSFYLWQEFYEFDASDESSIYECSDKSFRDSFHAIKISGWGENENGKFWLIENSWGRGFSSDGYFKLKRGDNVCGINWFVFAADPTLKYKRVLLHPTFFYLLPVALAPLCINICCVIPIIFCCCCCVKKCKEKGYCKKYQSLKEEILEMNNKSSGEKENEHKCDNV